MEDSRLLGMIQNLHLGEALTLFEKAFPIFLILLGVGIFILMIFAYFNWNNEPH